MGRGSLSYRRDYKGYDWADWLDVADEYMEFGSEIPLWDALLWGFLHTNLVDTSSGADARGFLELKAKFPTAEDAWYICDISGGEPYGRGGYDDWSLRAYSSRYLNMQLCNVAKHWDKIKAVLSRCRESGSSEEHRKARDELQDLFHNARKGREPFSEVTRMGFGPKGVDMLALDAGCQVPVADAHIIDNLIRDPDVFDCSDVPVEEANITQTKTQSERAFCQEMQERVEKPRRPTGTHKRDQPKLHQWLRPYKYYQDDPYRYDLMVKYYRQLIPESTPPGDYHVATWFGINPSRISPSDPKGVHAYNRIRERVQYWDFEGDDMFLELLRGFTSFALPTGDGNDDIA